ncbi:GlxA family transcriptional regulator [Gilvimarinus sp. DA14]|uniref:GlxA family transcriptional regulator n=1 Tax=Gilvimarinus sp. DA14 TaxID=2956798 RepID=UPI0020B6840C|nr:GlxA family transcriptional regulator [Gilvimarinus sp. DA14]UTF60672.1 GlxA family transcriptional regulator [Gilvimarinus sp. DA14]
MQIGFLLFDGFQTMDIAGPLDALDLANQWLAEQREPPLFELKFISQANKKLTSEPGLTYVADISLNDVETLDWLIIPGGKGTRELMNQPETLRKIIELSTKASRVISICTGAYILAATGLIDGQSCCSHWRFIDDLAQRFPKVKFDSNSLYTVHDKYLSSGGLSTGIDLTLWLIEQELGKQAAQYVARNLVVYLRRSGDQSQFSSALSVQSMDSRFSKLQDWLMDNLNKAITIEDMADQVALSPRQFRRVFSEQIQLSPKEYLDQIRLDRGRNLLLSTHMQIEDIARQTGFSDSDVFRRRFKKQFDITPGEYRKHFC